jgi:nitrate/nitrite transporter NarK
MKKTLLSMVAIATLALTGATFASYTGNVVDYYNMNNSGWTIQLTGLGNISLTNANIYQMNGQRVAQYYQDAVACNIARNMCYAGTDAMRAFGFDVYAFTRGQEEVTNKKVEFVNLYTKIYVVPTLK